MDESTAERAGAILRLVCVLAADIATMLGLYLDADELFCGICAILAIVALIWCWWKNNNITDAAIEAQRLLDALKDGDLSDLVDDDEEDDE